jgi:predicted permease
VAEVALAVVAIAGAGLFIKSYSQAVAIRPGFDSSGVLAGQFFLRADGFSSDQIIQTSLRLKRQFEETAGVATAAYADQIPLTYSNAGPWHVIEIDGYQAPSGRQLTVDRAAVSPGYFATLRIPLVEGRDFNELDTRQSPQVIIVNQAFVERYLASGHALGRQIKVGGQPSTIVGICGDTKVFSLHEPPRPYLYRPYDQAINSGSNLAYFVRAAGDPARIVSTLRNVPTRVDGRLAAFEAIPMAEYNGAAVLPQKLAASLLSFLAVLSLLLSGVGLYGVLACSVAERTKEIGIRLALGAEPLNVVRMILRRALILTAIGAAAGIAAAFAVARIASTFLYGVSPADPLAYLGAAFFLALVVAPASYLPARRALQADPMDALRAQ